MIDLLNSTKDLDGEKKEKCDAALARVLQYNHVGFIDLLDQDQNWEASSTIGSSLREKFKTMVIVGIGGSSLAARAIEENCSKISDDHQLLFIDTVDAYYFWESLKSLDPLDDVCWLFVSKSGATIETLTCANYIAQYLADQGMDISNSSVVLSEDKDAPLTMWARQQKIKVVPLAENIGGRYSVFTPVGMVPAVFLGAMAEDFRTGAKKVLDDRDLISGLAAQAIESFASSPITVFWMYSQRMSQFGRWIQQLWAESLGKSETRSGAKAPIFSTPYPAVGPADQHSILQQVMDAQRDKFIWFFRIGDAEDYGPNLNGALFDSTRVLEGKGIGALMAAEARATRDSLARAGVDSLTLSLRSLSPRNMGALFMLMQLVVATIAEYSDINAFDQPGVEAGKVLANQYLNG